MQANDDLQCLADLEMAFILDCRLDDAMPPAPKPTDHDYQATAAATKVGCTIVTAREADEGQACSICLQPYRRRQMVAEVGCQARHRFHKKCLDKWMQQSDRCPLDNSKLDN